jgi:hypothetical protein
VFAVVIYSIPETDGFGERIKYDTAFVIPAGMSEMKIHQHFLRKEWY